MLTTAHALLKWASQKPHATFVELLMSQGLVVALALVLYGGIVLIVGGLFLLQRDA